MNLPMTLPPVTPDLLAQWIQPGTLSAAFIALFVAVVQGLKGDIRASEARLENAVQSLKEDIRASEVRQDKRIGEVREEIKELRTKMEALENKLDRVLESLLAVKSA